MNDFVLAFSPRARLSSVGGKCVGSYKEDKEEDNAGDNDACARDATVMIVFIHVRKMIIDLHCWRRGKRGGGGCAPPSERRFNELFKAAGSECRV